MTDPRWAGARSPAWQYLLLDPLDQPLGRLDGVRGGSLSIEANARLGGSASISVRETAQRLDFLNHRVQIRYDPGVAGVDPHPFGVFLLTSPEEEGGAARGYEIGLLPKLVVIDEDTVLDSFAVEEGTEIIPEVVRLIQSTGELRIAATPSEATVTNQLVFEAGASKLTIINELLRSAGYRSLWCDGSGQFRIEPYADYGSIEEPVWAFATGELSLVKPDWRRTQNLAGIPNRVVVVSPGTDVDDALVGIAENHDPESPFSIENRYGRIITRREEVADLSSVEEANAQAERLLFGGMSPVAHLMVTHAIVPLEPRDFVTFTDERGTRRSASVQKMDFDLGSFASQCQAEWRETSGMETADDE